MGRPKQPKMVEIDISFKNHEPSAIVDLLTSVIEWYARGIELPVLTFKN